MSTRAVYGFRDQHGTHHVYVHHDGYPTGAAEKFEAVLVSPHIWQLPRFEADEFAAGFICANKDSGGGVRLTHGPEQHGDTEYYYVVYQPEPGKGPLFIEAHDGGDSKSKLMFKGPLSEFIATAAKIEETA